MKERTLLLSWLALAAPLLAVLSLLALLTRPGITRLQALPPLLIAGGLLASSVLSRRQQRRRLLLALRHPDD